MLHYLAEVRDEPSSWISTCWNIAHRISECSSVRYSQRATDQAGCNPGQSERVVDGAASGSPRTERSCAATETGDHCQSCGDHQLARRIGKGTRCAWSESCRWCSHPA